MAGEFVYNSTALPAAKGNAVSVPSGASETNYFQGTDYNLIKAALEDCRHVIKRGGGSISPQAAAPVAGTFAVGEIVMNSAPAEGANLGWVCITAGTPGTWLEFGVISSDVLNGGGGGGGGGASDITEPERLIGTNKAEIDLYPTALVGGRKGQIGFITASSIDLVIKNEYTGDADISLEPGDTGDVLVPARNLDVQTGWVAANEALYTDVINTYSGSVSNTNIPINTEAIRVTGVDEARVELYPDGSGSGRKGLLGFLSAAVNVLEIRNEKASGGNIKLTPGSGGGVIFNGTTTIKAINTFTATDNWNGAGSSSGVNFDYTVSGVAVGDIILGVTHSGVSLLSGQQLTGQVTAANTVNVTWRNYSGSTQDPTSGTITIIWADIT